MSYSKAFYSWLNIATFAETPADLERILTGARQELTEIEYTALQGVLIRTTSPGSSGPGGGINQMTALDIRTHGDNCWPDLKDEAGQPTFITGQLVSIARLPRGTASGKSSVTMRIELPNGQIVLAETTLALLSNAVAAFNIAEEMEL